MSGTRGDTIFYRRSIPSCGNKIWNDLVIEYPAVQKAAYDAIVEPCFGIAARWPQFCRSRELPVTRLKVT